ncbi:Hypothetical predicted protein [Olea europaea subsp. europaea]|uniref:Uncharacterized protein n=1 Tax=Olea europaea subsp. europaea TaxID=158383 RepID=A0A8S0TWQ0_OLEEU|nr:Hypothetical predicted protein [Olea europaea subsp. europaea]
MRERVRERGNGCLARCFIFFKFSVVNLIDINFSSVLLAIPLTVLHFVFFISLCLHSEGEFSSSAYHDLGQHAISAEHTAVSSMAHPCPYIAYFGPIHPSSTSSGTISDGSNFNNQWSAHSVPDQSLMPSVTQRTARTSSDIPRPGSVMHPLFVGHSSGTRTPSSNSSMVPHYPGSVARARDRVQALHGSFQQPSSSPAASTPPIPTSRRSNSHRGLPQVAPVASPSDQSGCFYYFSSGSSGRTVQETENHVPNRFHSWNQEHFPSFSLNQVDRDPVWGPFHPAGSGSDTGYRSGSFHQRHGSERMPSQNRS